MYEVYTVILENNNLQEYFYGRWDDERKANEVALELRPYYFSTIVYKR